MSTERIGVHEVGSIIEKMGFAFREQPVEDYGIDAIIEERQSGYLSGKLIGVQIKSGPSYFSKERNGKVVFYVDEKHYSYWLNYSIPVILVLYNPDTGLCIYETVEAGKMFKTKKGWKIDIPLTNHLSSAIDALKNIASSQDEYHKRLSTLALSTDLMELADNGELILEVLEWVNKSSGRGEFILKKVDSNGNEIVLVENTIFGFGLKAYENVIQELFPWADIKVDDDFYDKYADRDLIDNSMLESDIYPYENRAGEVDAYRLKLGVNEIGNAFFVLNYFLNNGNMYNVVF